MSATHAWVSEYLGQQSAKVEEAEIHAGGLQGDTLDFGPGPWVIVVDGDLLTPGDLTLDTRDNSIIVVTGSVRARNVFFDEGTLVVIENDLVATGVVVGTHGDSNAGLDVGGALTARGVFLDAHTGMTVRGPLNALVSCAPGWKLPQDFVGQDQRTLFVPEALNGERVDAFLVRQLAAEGRAVDLPHAEVAARESVKRLRGT
jgi:hypothetical protein